jgi:hypothetical protein
MFGFRRKLKLTEQERYAIWMPATAKANVILERVKKTNAGKEDPESVPFQSTAASKWSTVDGVIIAPKVAEIKEPMRSDSALFLPTS